MGFIPGVSFLKWLSPRPLTFPVPSPKNKLNFGFCFFFKAFEKTKKKPLNFGPFKFFFGGFPNSAPFS